MYVHEPPPPSPEGGTLLGASSVGLATGEIDVVGNVGVLVGKTEVIGDLLGIETGDGLLVPPVGDAVRKPAGVELGEDVREPVESVVGTGVGGELEDIVGDLEGVSVGVAVREAVGDDVGSSAEK